MHPFPGPERSPTARPTSRLTKPLAPMVSAPMRKAGRSFVLPNGSLDFNLGLTHGPFGETTPIGDISYTHTSEHVPNHGNASTPCRNQHPKSAKPGRHWPVSAMIISSTPFERVIRRQLCRPDDEGVGPSNRRQRANFDASYTRALTQRLERDRGLPTQIDDNSAPWIRHWEFPVPDAGTAVRSQTLIKPGTLFPYS